MHSIETTGPAPRRRVIVADASADTTLSAALLLKQADFEVLDFNRAADVVPAALGFRPDAVLLDLSLGASGSGLEVARQIRQHPALQQVLLVAVTGWTRPQDRAQAAACGFDHFLVKPAAPEQMIELICAIDRRRNVSAPWPAQQERRRGQCAK